MQDILRPARPLAEARDEMLCAVNSLPVKGRKVHQRVMVAKLPVAADGDAGKLGSWLEAGKLGVGSCFCLVRVGCPAVGDATRACVVGAEDIKKRA